MAVTAVITAVADQLRTVLPGTVSIGATVPSGPGQTPAIALGLVDLEAPRPGIGATPAPTRTGALAVERSFDLDDVSVTFPDGERIGLLSADRRDLQLPHGSIVKADGFLTGAFAASDLSVVVAGNALEPVTTPPGPGECRPDAVTGVVELGQPAPASGSLEVGYFVGAWDVTLQQYVGGLVADVFGTSTDVADVSDQVLATLDVAPGSIDAAIPSFRSIVPVAVGTIGRAEGLTPPTDTRRVEFRFDFERQVPRILTGGGPIRTVDVDNGPGAESFVVHRRVPV